MSGKFILLAAVAALSWGAFANVEEGQARAAVRSGGAPAAVMFGGVTNIKEIVNRTAHVVKVQKNEFTGNYYTGSYQDTNEIPADGVWTGDMWVPWANNGEEFKNHWMAISVRTPRRTSGGTVQPYTAFYLWQSGEYVRFNDENRFVDNAPRVPGESHAGGERRLIISTRDNKPVFTFEKFKP